MNYEKFLEKYGAQNPLWCYTELVTIGTKCVSSDMCYQDKGEPDEKVCPFRVLLDFLKNHSPKQMMSKKART